jgi:hypothetical protein
MRFAGRDGNFVTNFVANSAILTPTGHTSGPLKRLYILETTCKQPTFNPKVVGSIPTGGTYVEGAGKRQVWGDACQRPMREMSRISSMPPGHRGPRTRGLAARATCSSYLESRLRRARLRTDSQPRRAECRGKPEATLSGWPRFASTRTETGPFPDQPDSPPPRLLPRRIEVWSNGAAVEFYAPSTTPGWSR